MFNDIFLQADLSENESAIYGTLLEHGELTAGQIIDKTGIKRGNTYYLLDKLEAEDLVERFKVAKKTFFRVAHPAKLEEYVMKRQTELSAARNSLRAAMPDLVGAFAMHNSRPGIQTYTSAEDFNNALQKTLEVSGELVAFVNAENMNHVSGPNDPFIKKRIKNGVKRRMLIVDNEAAKPYIRAAKKDSTIEARLLDPSFDMGVVEVYDDRVAYIVGGEDEGFLAFEVQHPEIYKWHRAIFDHYWKDAPEV